MNTLWWILVHRIWQTNSDGMRDCSRMPIRSCSEPGKPGKPFPALVRGSVAGELGLALASLAAAVLSTCEQAALFVSHFTAAFQATAKRKSGCFCTPATLPVIYTPPCCSLCNVGFFRKHNSHPGEEKPICSISPIFTGFFNPNPRHVYC